MELIRLGELLFSETSVYGLQVDSLLREIAKRVPTQAFLAFYLSVDPQDPLLDKKLREFRRESFQMQGDAIMISRHDPIESSEGEKEVLFSEVTIPLKITFADSNASTYYFGEFPALDLPFVSGYTRSRRAESHFVLLTVPDREALQVFVERCRKNPWVTAVDELPEEKVRAHL